MQDSGDRDRSVDDDLMEESCSREGARGAEANMVT
jgi:hypothetical protein